MLLDGTRDFEALVADVVKLAQEGKIGVRERKAARWSPTPRALEQILRYARRGEPAEAGGVWRCCWSDAPTVGHVAASSHCASHSASMPTLIVATAFFVRQATAAATSAATSFGFV